MMKLVPLVAFLAACNGQKGKIKQVLRAAANCTVLQRLRQGFFYVIFALHVL